MASKQTSTKKATSHLKFKIYSDVPGEWRWQLKSGNGKIIADSAEGYQRKSHCAKMVDLIRGSALYAKVEGES